MALLEAARARVEAFGIAVRANGAGVELGALVLVAQDVICPGNLLEFLLRGRVPRMLVGVMLLGQRPKRLLDFGLAGRLGHTQDLVRVFHACLSRLRFASNWAFVSFISRVWGEAGTFGNCCGFKPLSGRLSGDRKQFRCSRLRPNGPTHKCRRWRKRPGIAYWSKRSPITPFICSIPPAWSPAGMPARSGSRATAPMKSSASISPVSTPTRIALVACRPLYWASPRGKASSKAKAGGCARMAPASGPMWW